MAPPRAPAPAPNPRPATRPHTVPMLVKSAGSIPLSASICICCGSRPGICPPVVTRTSMITAPITPLITALTRPAIAPALAPLPAVRSGSRNQPASTPIPRYSTRLIPQPTRAQSPARGMTNWLSSVTTIIATVPISPAFKPALPTIHCLLFDVQRIVRCPGTQMSRPGPLTASPVQPERTGGTAQRAPVQRAGQRAHCSRAKCPPAARESSPSSPSAHCHPPKPRQRSPSGS